MSLGLAIEFRSENCPRGFAADDSNAEFCQKYLALWKSVPERSSQRFMNMNYRASARRKKALQCERAAKIATDADARRVYLDVARQWRDRAQHTEELERHTSASRTESNASQQSIADKQSFVSASSRRLTP
jgi:hypothetical protein